MKWQSLVAKCYKIRKIYSSAKFTIISVLRTEKSYHFSVKIAAKMVTPPPRLSKKIVNDLFNTLGGLFVEQKIRNDEEHIWPDVLTV